MPQIQTVLASGGTSPKDFSLHDQGHSFRVAERMQAIAGDVIVILSAFELSLLLLSAYLHDIGMTPEFKKVHAHYNYLLTGEKSVLSDEDILLLQTWLDNEGYQVVPPISDAMPLSDRLKLAGELTTYYCRYRHNIWSAEWIEAHLSSELLGTYNGWIEDLILLCQSHHFGYVRLKDQAFRPRWVGEPAAVVNLRYLALVLRVADILEFDPERTPEVILRHRDIAPESQIYWWKDKAVSLKMADRSIVISARPSSARLHRAIDDMADGIDAELALCRNVADEFPLGAVPGSPEQLSYQWVLPSSVHRDITPREGAYEYIDGAFRPDTKKLLTLLSGTSLYQDPVQAVRELVQNAFDAVCERMAYQRLVQPNPASATLAKQLAKQHRVSLQLETEGPDAYLVCIDNGIGMTKAIIRDRVLVSGSGPRHDVRALDRRCKEAGFQLGRSGQFGIGILSYFMVATTVEIETQRAQEAGDADSATWYFETEGIGSFGELRKLAANRLGTRVRLRLRPEISSNLAEWYNKLRSYLVDTIVHCPCEFYLSSPIPECEPLEFEPGWCPYDYDQEAFGPLRSRGQGTGTPTDLVSLTERERRLAAERENVELEKEFRSHLRWRCEEGTLSDGTAHYIIRLPYFELEGGASLAFLRPKRMDKVRLIHHVHNGTHYLPAGELREAWKGMTVAMPTQGQNHNVFGRINWVSEAAGTIMVHRNAFAAGGTGETGRLEVAARWKEMVTRFLDEFKDSEYAWFNHRLVGMVDRRAKHFRWLAYEPAQGPGTRQNAEFSWGDIKFPAVSESAFGYNIAGSSRPQHRFVVDGKPINVVPLAVAQSMRGIGWNTALMSPDRVVYLESWGFGMAPIWLRHPRNGPSPPLLDSKFPPEWNELCGAKFEWYAGYNQPALVWNRSHPVVKQVNFSAWEWCTETFQTSADPVPHRDKLLSNSALAASWALQCIGQDSKQLWNGLPDRDPKFLPELFSLLFQIRKVPASPRLLLWDEEPALSSLRIVDSQQWIDVRADEDVRQHLPAPSAKWRIERTTDSDG